MKIMFACIMLTGLIVFSSCATMTGVSKYQVIKVYSNPPDADVYLDGRYQGKTPAYMKLKRGIGKKHIRVAKTGYIPETETLRSGTEPCFWGNLFIPFVGAIVDLINGVAYKWYPEDFYFDLMKHNYNYAPENAL